MASAQVVTSAVEQVLLELGESGASGCLTVTDSAGEQSEVYFKDGVGLFAVRSGAPGSARGSIDRRWRPLT